MVIDITRYRDGVIIWEEFPTLKYLKPYYNELYKKDKSKNKYDSSLTLWSIVFLNDPDQENMFYSQDYNERIKNIKENFNKKFDDNDELVKVIMENFPEDNLTAVEKAFKEEVDSLVKRAKLIKNTEYTFDSTEKDEKGNTIFVSGKPLVKKGTATDIDKMRVNSLKIYEQYDELRKKFIKERSDTRIHGGRKESLSERNIL